MPLLHRGEPTWNTLFHDAYSNAWRIIANKPDWGAFQFKNQCWSSPHCNYSNYQGTTYMKHWITARQMFSAMQIASHVRSFSGSCWFFYMTARIKSTECRFHQFITAKTAITPNSPGSIRETRMQLYHLAAAPPLLRQWHHALKLNIIFIVLIARCCLPRVLHVTTSASERKHSTYIQNLIGVNNSIIVFRHSQASLLFALVEWLPIRFLLSLRVVLLS